MRIAHVANFYSPVSGGLRTTMHALARGYRHHGHAVMMVVPGEHDAVEETAWGTRVSIAAPLVPASGGYRIITRLEEIRSHLDDFAPEVLEISDRTTLPTLTNWAHHRSVPTVLLAHERLDGVLHHFASALPDAPVTWIADALNSRLARRFDSVIATTQYAGQEFQRIGVDTRIVPLGVDADHFHPRRRHAVVRAAYASPEESLIVMASRLSREKRPDLAIDAVAQIEQAGHRVRLVVAGEGPRVAALQRQATGLPVTFAGFIADRSHFAALLASADAMIAPGPIETFGLSALESLASGTPVVVNAASALPEVVADAGESADDTSSAMADALVRVLSDTTGTRRTRARQRAEEFPWSATVARMLSGHSSSLEAVSA